MASCTVTFTVNTAALSGAVEFEPFPNQIVSGTAIDNRTVIATASGNAYTASLIQGARYRIKSALFNFSNPRFTVPASSSANLYDILDGSASQA